MIRHPRVELVAGDDWQFTATMLDPSGNPIDLSSATILWMMLDASGYRAVQSSDYTIELGSDPGVCIVKIAASHSTTMQGGEYTDYWRVTANNVTQTLLAGILGVLADPFTAAAESSQQQPKTITGTMGAAEAVDGFGCQRGRFSNVHQLRRGGMPFGGQSL